MAKERKNRMIQKDRLALGLAALRSGNYTQGTGELKKIENGVVKHCCLGVLTDIAIANGCDTMRPNPGNPVKYQILIDGPVCKSATCTTCIHTDGPEWMDADLGVLHDVVQDFYGFQECDPVIGMRLNPDYDSFAGFGSETVSVTATVANDRLDWDFHQIAQGFEDTYMGVNGDPASGTDPQGESSSPS